MVLLSVAAVVAVILLWWLRDALLLAFAAIVVAVGLNATAQTLRSPTKLSHRWSVVSSLALIFSGVCLVGWLVGAQIMSQLNQVSVELPKAVQSLEAYTGISLPSPSELRDGGDGTLSVLDGVAGQVAMWGWTLANGAAILFLILVGGVFLALNPSVYRRGLLRLFPERMHEEVEQSMDDSARGLQLWLVGQLISMAIMGSLVTLGTWALGLPAPLALGILAGVAEFVPMLGPVLGAIPALLLALTQDSTTALWTLVLFVAIQQLESNIIMPQVQRKMVQIPPALFLFSVFAFGILFGIAGVFLAGPLTVAAFVLIRRAVS